MFDEDWFTGKGSSASSWINERKKKREEEAQARLEATLKTKPAEDEPKPEDGQDEQSIMDKLGGAAGAVGNFFKDAAVDVKDTAVGAYTGVKDVIEGSIATNENSKIAEERLRISRENSEALQKAMGADYDDPKSSKWDSPEIKSLIEKNNQRFNEFNESKKDVEQKNQEQFKESQAVDAKKTAFQAGETALNIGTLGIGTIPKAVAKQGSKAIIKQAIKTGGTKAAAEIIKTSSEAAVKKAAQEALESGAKRLAKKAGKGAAMGAMEGAAYGVTQTGKNDPDAEAEDFLLNAAFGAGIGGVIGGAIPVTGAGIKKGVNKIKDGKAAKTAAKTTKATDPDDVNGLMNQAIEEQSDKYGTNAFTRAKQWVGDQVNPYRALAKIDDGYAKMTGKDRHLLEAGENLEDLARRSAVSEREAAALFYKELDLPDGSKTTAADLVKKYKGDSPEGMEFNNYTNAKFDLEFREKKGGNNRIQRNLEDDQLKKFVADYEAKNPDAVRDLSVKKRVNDEAVDYMVNSGAISKAEGETIKTSYKNAVPLERIFPDDLERPQVTGKNVGSIAKQTVIQRLEGGSDIPLSNSFDTMLNRVYKAVSQGNRAKLAQKLLERSEQGLIAGSNVMTTGANKAARNVLREQQALITKGVRNLESKSKISNRQIRKIASELNKLNKEGLNKSLKTGGKNKLPGFTTEALEKLSTTKGKTTTSRAFFKSLVEADPADLERIRKKIATREPKLATKLDEVANIRREIDALRAVKTDLKEVTAEFADDPTTGKQVISGLIDGEPYKMEVPPALAKAVQGLDNKKVDGILKVFATIKKPFEVTWTGVFNPVFAATSFLVYDTPMSFINSPQGRKVFAPKAVLEGFKSFRSSSKFQRALAAEGARPYGGSGASAFTKPDAKAIAAQRNILSNLAYTAKNPEVALSKIDVFGGKLANSTRTRIARAEYDSVLKAAKKEGKNIKSPEVQKAAMEQAALAYRTIMPDYDTMSHLTRQVNSVVPFYAASVAGTRSFGQAIRRDPRNTLIKAATVGVIPTIGVTAFSLASPQGRAFYEDMIDAGSERILDDNLVIVLPGAEKDETTGEWKGIVKIPLAPEFRAINQTTWRATRDLITGDNETEASHVAWSIFDTITGGVRNSENPLVSTRRILSGEDPRTGEQIVKGNMANLPKEEQVYSWTSQAGKVVGGLLNTSPIQGDKILGQFGLLGQTAKNGGQPLEAIADNVANKVTGAYGERANDSFFKTYSPLKARRDKASKEITTLIKAGKRNEARRKADEFNQTLSGTFGQFEEKFGESEVRDPMWDELMSGLLIKTSESGFDARAKQ